MLRILLLLFLLPVIVMAGEYPLTLTIEYGTTPVLDGYIGEDEYVDAAFLPGVAEWESGTGTPSQDPEDLSVKAWYKHDGVFLYFAFDVTDDVLYGYDIERWVHSNNPTPHAMDQSGWPWFGDGMEIMMNSSYEWNGADECAGDAQSWQVVFSSHKSREHELDSGGLMMGEPRNDYAWGNYGDWIDNGHIKVGFRLKSETEGRGYVVEWQIDPAVCMQKSNGEFIDLGEPSTVGINLEFQDLDEKEKGEGNWSNMHHIDFLGKVDSYRKTALISYATLKIIPNSNPSITEFHPDESIEVQIYPDYSTKNISIETNTSENLKVSLFDLKGRLVYNTSFRESCEINYEGISSGIYLLCFQHANFYIKPHKVFIE